MTTRTIIAALAILVAGPALSDVPIPKPNPLRTQDEAPTSPPAAPTPQPTCMMIDKVQSDLEAQFGELPRTSYSQPNGMVLVMFRNAEKGNWTGLWVLPDGCVRLLGAGERSRVAREVPKGDPT